MAISRNDDKHRAPMQNLPSCMFLLLMLLLLLHSGYPPTTAAVRENNNSTGFMGSLVEDSDELAGGFPTWDSTLQRAIDHSYTEKSKEKAEYTEKVSPKEISRKQSPIKEIIKREKMPDVQLMKIIVADLSKSSYPFEKRLWALSRLLGLVELTDNALVMDKLGGLVAVVKELRDTESEIRATSAWVLGKASQNNVLVQNQILGYGALTRLMKMVHSSDTEEAVKAFYAISSLIRNNKRGQALFYLKGGDILLQDMLTNSGIDTRLQKKVLLVLKSLLHVASTKALDVLEFFSLEQALETVRVQLEELTSDEDLAGFARNVEILFWQLGLRNDTLMQ